MISPVGKRRRRRNRAFTLIELALVALIILTLLGLTAPLFKRTLSDLAAKETAFTIAKLMTYAQEKAILERKNFKMAFNFKTGRYQILDMKDRVGKARRAPKGITLTGSRQEMVFYPDGNCDEIDINILLKDGAGYVVRSKGFGRALEIKEIKNVR